MKKTLILALCLALCLAAPALATQAETITVPIDGLFTLAHPADLKVEPLSALDVENGLLYDVYSEDDEFELTVYKYKNEDAQDAQALMEDYNSSGELSEVKIAELAGMPAVFYRIEVNCVAVTLVADNGFLYDLVFTYPEDGEGLQMVEQIEDSLAPATGAQAE